MPLGVASLPVLNALLNAVSALLLAGGHAFVRRIEAHMLGAFGVSVGYLPLRYFAGMTRFAGQGVGAPSPFYDGCDLGGIPRTGLPPLCGPLPRSRHARPRKQGGGRKGFPWRAGARQGRAQGTGYGRWSFPRPDASPPALDASSLGSVSAVTTRFRLKRRSRLLPLRNPVVAGHHSL